MKKQPKSGEPDKGEPMDRVSDTELLDGLEHDQALLQMMATKVQIYSVWVAHLLMRLEAVSPQSAVFMTDRHMKMATGLSLNVGDPQDGRIAIFVGCDQKSVEYVRVDELTRRATNGIGQVESPQSRTRPEGQGSGIVSITGKELPSVQRPRTDSGPGEPGTPGKI